jgi:hypothetical protein
MAVVRCPDADDTQPMGTDARRVEWIVCAGRTRSVLAGEVQCPRLGQIGPSVCFECRHLMATSAERASATWCVMPEPEMLGGVDRDWRRDDVHPNQLAARLQRAGSPEQPSMLKQGVDSGVAGQHLGLQDPDPAPTGRGDGRRQQRATEAVALPIIRHRNADLLDAAAVQRACRLEVDVADDVAGPIKGHESIPAASADAPEPLCLQVGDAVAGPEEARAPAVV